MLQSQTAVLEKNTTFRGDFATEPFEVAWAREGRWFFQVLESSGDPAITLRTQVSPDGLTWVDLPEDAEHEAIGTGLTTWCAREFGGWMRVRGTFSGAGSVKVRIYLAVKS
jgi:hypothetical protein